MAEFDAETVDALNTLLEDERASVEMEVALASGASDYTERERLTAMGADDIGFCVALHERLEEAGAPVTRRINGVVFQALGAERYDDRLLVFARHQLLVNERYRDLPTHDLDDEMRDLLRTIAGAHTQQIDWLERRAQAFAATRLFDFRSGNVGGSGASGSGGADADAEQAPRAEPPDPHAASDADDGPEQAPYTGYATPTGADDTGDTGYETTPAPAAPPPVRRRYGAYRPGAPTRPYSGAVADGGAHDGAPAQPPTVPYSPYTYAESAYPYAPPDAPDGAGYAPPRPYPDGRDDDNQP